MKVSEVINSIMDKENIDDLEFSQRIGYSFKYFNIVKYEGVNISNHFLKKIKEEFPLYVFEISELKKIINEQEKKRKIKIEERKKIGKQVQRFRESLGLNLKEFASEINMYYTNFKKIESGIHPLSNDKLQKILNTFKISIYDLMNVKSPKDDMIEITEEMFNKLTLLRKNTGEAYTNLAEKINMSNYIFRTIFINEPPFKVRKDVFLEILNGFGIDSIDNFNNLDIETLKGAKIEKYIKENNIAQGIIKLRDKHGLSNNKFAKRVGIDSSMITRLLKNERKMSLKCFKKMLETFDVNFEEFKKLNEEK